ncbi:Low affinity immunoglobulin gamma Fc region receptor II [Oryzias melastigma]|nr:Low affinity immunoglobulin gamma Fc region receptor II [Oryzias melastigma]
MELAALCSVFASLRVLPSRSQFFQYESVTLNCELHGNLSGWRIRRTIDQGNTTEDCPSSSSVCFIRELYYMDSGVYWCESAEGKCSNKVNITVTARDLILEAPVLPVVEGEAVTLGCRNRTSSGFSFFYKNRLLVGNSSTGNWTIGRVSKSDEGFYQCSSSGRDYFSPDSWLDVTGVLSSGETPAWPLTPVLLPVVGVCLLFTLMLLFLWRNLKGKVDRSVSYIDVTITPDVEPRRIRDVEDTSTFYSMLNLAGSSQQLDQC